MRRNLKVIQRRNSRLKERRNLGVKSEEEFGCKERRIFVNKLRLENFDFPGRANLHNLPKFRPDYTPIPAQLHLETYKPSITLQKTMTPGIFIFRLKFYACFPGVTFRTGIFFRSWAISR